MFYGGKGHCCQTSLWHIIIPYQKTVSFKQGFTEGIMATIKEIAKACGVSTATVSKALNGYSDIGEETTKLVKDTAAKMGYFPNASARALKTNHSNNLGVLFIDKRQSGLGHDYFSFLLEGFKVRAEQLGYDITFISRNLGGRTMSYLEHCLYRRVDGVIIASVDFDDPQVLELVNSKIPVVTIDHVFNNRSAVLSDNVGGAMELTRHVCEMGHKNIAFIHGEDTSVTQKRIAGFYRVCEEYGLKIPESNVKPALYHDPQSSGRATRELLEQNSGITCILYPDDFSFVGGMNEIERRGLRIPQDISVAGYDGVNLSQVLRPKLTTLMQDSPTIGKVAADTLIQAIKEPKTVFPQQILIPGKLLVGGTVKAL